MIESKMSTKLKNMFPEIMFQNIETSTGFGVPDIAYGHKAINGWLELKSIDERVPVNRCTIPWKPGQLAWYHNYKNKYKCTQPYLLILTIKDSWYFITENIKEKYIMSELRMFYFCETKDLRSFKRAIKNKLLGDNNGIIR